MYKLGARSKEKLYTTKQPLIQVVERAIEITTVDFSVLEGIRSQARQFDLWQAKASKLNGAERGTMIRGHHGTGISNHQTEEAVDLGAYVAGSIRWDFNLYYQIARAMRQAAIEENVEIRWGCVWDRRLNDLSTNIEIEVSDYVLRRKSVGKKAFLDGPHYELV